MKDEYFNLPFEVHYHDKVGVTSFEFMSDIPVQKFADIKVLRKQEGRSTNPIFLCRSNSGPELFCCIINGHDQVQPEWLEMSEEDDINFNYEVDLKISVDGNSISFQEIEDEDQDPECDVYIDFEKLDYCSTYSFYAYELEQSTPEYIILDADNSRVKVDLNGYVLDGDGNPTAERIFDPEELYEREDLQNYSSLNMQEATENWVKLVIEESFPDEKNLDLS
jgi:hypothetical protein